MRNAVSYEFESFSTDEPFISLTKYRTNYRVNKLSIHFSFFVTVWTFRPVPTLFRTAIFRFSYPFPIGDGLQFSGPFSLAPYLSPFHLFALSTPSGNFVLIDFSLLF